mmetsp:Transcript_9234/g.33682  ORF Transcript_9234/g.33682 Transcript_9234/m.33682 type:complete len:283 (-) Transcript_9234:147-995(-)
MTAENTSSLFVLGASCESNAIRRERATAASVRYDGRRRRRRRNASSATDRRLPSSRARDFPAQQVPQRLAPFLRAILPRVKHRAHELLLLHLPARDPEVYPRDVEQPLVAQPARELKKLFETTRRLGVFALRASNLPERAPRPRVRARVPHDALASALLLRLRLARFREEDRAHPAAAAAPRADAQRVPPNVSRLLAYRARGAPQVDAEVVRLLRVPVARARAAVAAAVRPSDVKPSSHLLSVRHPVAREDAVRDRVERAHRLRGGRGRRRDRGRQRREHER